MSVNTWKPVNTWIAEPDAFTQSVAVAGLASNTTYYIHYVQDTGVDSNVVTSPPFTTEAATATINGTPQLQGLTASGTVALTSTITGSAQIQPLTGSGTITTFDTVTGAPQMQQLTSAGSIQVGDIVVINGAAQLQSITSAGSITLTSTVAGSAQLQNITSTGSVTLNTPASASVNGSAQLQNLVASGSITLTSKITGTPQLQNLTSTGLFVGVVSLADLQTQIAALQTLVLDLHQRLDMDAANPNTYANDASIIENNQFTLTKTDNGDGTSTVQRS